MCDIIVVRKEALPFTISHVLDNARPSTKKVSYECAIIILLPNHRISLEKAYHLYRGYGQGNASFTLSFMLSFIQWCLLVHHNVFTNVRVGLCYAHPSFYLRVASHSIRWKVNKMNSIRIRTLPWYAWSGRIIDNSLRNWKIRMQNYAARVILRLPKSSSITMHLKSLHWLPLKVRSTYKIACLCYHFHSSTSPSYVTDMLHRKPLHTRNTRSSS